MTNEQVKADIAANLPDNTTRVITPAKLRTEMGKMVDYSDTAVAAAVAEASGRSYDNVAISDVAAYQTLAPSLASPLSIPTPYDAVAPSALLHPSVVHIPTGWWGYEYWMASTPYPNFDSQYENPLIHASHDGTTWVVPAGASNPIAAKPTAGNLDFAGVAYAIDGFFSDTHLVLGPDGTLLVFFTENTNVQKLVRGESPNGATWAFSYVFTFAEYNIGSPAIQWDGQQWWMWYKCGDSTSVEHPVTNAEYPTDPRYGRRLMMRKTSDRSARTGWTSPQQCTTAMPGSYVSGVQTLTPWHLDVHKIFGGWLALIQMCDNAEAGIYGSLYLARSSDGLSWAGSPHEIILNKSPSDTFYRSCFLPVLTTDGVALRLWCASWKVGNQPRLYDVLVGPYNMAEEVSDITGDVSTSIAGHNPLTILADRPSRADNPSDVGSADVGAIPYVATGGTWGVFSKQIGQSASTGSDRLTAAINSFDQDISVRVSAPAGGYAALNFRYKDAAGNYGYRIEIGGGNLTTTAHKISLARMVGYSGVILKDEQTYLSPKRCNGVNLRVVAKGNSVRVWINGFLFWDLIESGSVVGTMASGGFSGMALSSTSTGCRFSNIVANAP